MILKKSLLIFFSLIGFGSAAVTVVWTEDGLGVTAMYSGFINTSVYGEADNTELYVEEAIRNNQAFAYYDGGELNRYRAVRTTAPPIVIEAIPAKIGTGFGDVFSFAADDLFVDVNYVSGAPLSGEAFFAGETFETIFEGKLDSLIGKTTVVWIDENDEELVFYNVVPESSTLALALMGVVGLLVRRRGN